jgi:hypothetical protein
MNEHSSLRKNRRFLLRIGLGIVFSGLFLYVLGINPGLFGLDRSPVFGFIQISVFLAGLGLICVGGYITFNALWNGSQKSIAADIGQRLVGTGFVIAVGSAMADLFGFGSQTYPTIPYFGEWQTIGVILGLYFITMGFVLIIPYPVKGSRRKETNLQ